MVVAFQIVNTLIFTFSAIMSWIMIRERYEDNSVKSYLIMLFWSMVTALFAIFAVGGWLELAAQ